MAPIVSGKKMNFEMNLGKSTWENRPAKIFMSAEIFLDPGVLAQRIHGRWTDEPLAGSPYSLSSF
jgi:hypothetical protein